MKTHDDGQIINLEGDLHEFTEHQAEQIGLLQGSVERMEDQFFNHRK